MSKIEVDKVDPQSGTTLTLGTSGDTVSIPSGVTLANAGTATGFASIAWQSSIVTAATLNADANKGYWIDTSSNACTVTLPGSASVGDQLYFVDYARNFGNNALTINQNSLNYQGNTSPNPVYDTNGQAIAIVYSGATKGWIPTSDDDVSNETPQSYSADFLVIAGGASGGQGNYGGGGGAGGFRTSTQTLNPGINITVTIGDGGAAQGSSSGGNNGNDSSFSGSGLTTITSTAGGGGGGGGNQNGFNGGSGGGGAALPSNGAGGSGNTPSTTPSQGNDGGAGTNNNRGGGGGGAGEAGNVPGDSRGGNGSASSITGSSVTRAGGGGGNNIASSAVGGSGGGGASGAPGVAGTANTGSGGGAQTGSTASGAGGKGVIIISVPSSGYTGTTTGSPTVTTSGSNTIMQFNGSGSYTS